MEAINPDTLAAITIWQEARGESYEGKLAVAQVIRNRMKRKYTSDGTVAGTVLHPYQFSGWNTDGKSRVASVAVDTQSVEYKDSLTAWSQSSGILSVFFPAVLYHAKDMTDYPYWATAEGVKKIAVIGNHIFYDEVK